jgi:hypothetical protein
VRIRSPRKRAGVSSIPPLEADAPNVVWAINFQFDSTIDGKAPEVVPTLRACATAQPTRSAIKMRHVGQLRGSSQRCRPENPRIMFEVRSWAGSTRLGVSVGSPALQA